MDVPTYQIHNVMKIFTSRLIKEGSGRDPRSFRRQAEMMAEAKRRAIATRVTAEVFNRLNQSGIASNRGVALGLPVEAPADPPRNQPTEFTYRIIDAENNERTASLSVEDPSFLTGRIEDLADDDR